MDLVGVELALHAPADELNTICLKGRPITKLQDLLGECLTAEVTPTLTRMGFLHNPQTLVIWHTSKEKSIKSLSMQHPPFDSIALGYSSEGFPIINCCIIRERPISTEVLNVIVPWVPIIKRLKILL